MFVVVSVAVKRTESTLAFLYTQCPNKSQCTLVQMRTQPPAHVSSRFTSAFMSLMCPSWNMSIFNIDFGF